MATPTVHFGDWLDGAPVSGSLVSFLYTLEGAPLPESVPADWPGRGVWVVGLPPAWNRSVRLVLELTASRWRTLTGREQREPAWTLPRVRMEWTAHVFGGQLVALRDALDTLRGGPVVVPVWPLMVESGSFRPEEHCDGALWAGFDGGGAGLQVGPAETFSRTGRRWFAPALVGKLVRQEVEVLTPEQILVTFEFLETGPSAWGLKPPVLTWTEGPALDDGYRPRVFPLRPDWGERTRAILPAVEVDDGESGAVRDGGRLVWPQAPFRGWDSQVRLFSAADVAMLLAWVGEHRLSALPYYAPWTLWTGRLAADAVAGAGVLELESAELLGSRRFLRLTRDGIVWEVVRVLAVTGNTLTLSAPLRHDWPAGRTLVSLEMLGRSEGDILEVTLVSPGHGVARFSFLEVPEEYLPASGETRGETLGGVTPRAWACAVTVNRNGVEQTVRCTSWEEGVSVNGDAFLPVPFEVGGASWSAELEATNVTLDILSEALAAALYPPAQSLDARVTVYRGPVVSGVLTPVEVYWTGTVESVEFSGPRLRMVVGPALARLRMAVPRRLVQPQCNYVLFTGGCGLSRGDWQFTARVYAVSGAQVVVESLDRTGGLPAGFGTVPGWFDGGELQRPNSARFHVAASSGLDAGGRMTLVLALAPETPPLVGELVTLVPGCDGLPETCRAWDAVNNPRGRFDNWKNFGGFPFVPEENPAFDPPDKRHDAQGKK